MGFKVSVPAASAGKSCWLGRSFENLDLGSGYAGACICKNSPSCTMKICMLYRQIIPRFLKSIRWQGTVQLSRAQLFQPGIAEESQWPGWAPGAAPFGGSLKEMDGPWAAALMQGDSRECEKVVEAKRRCAWWSLQGKPIRCGMEGTWRTSRPDRTSGHQCSVTQGPGKGAALQGAKVREVSPRANRAISSFLHF